MYALAMYSIRQRKNYRPFGSPCSISASRNYTDCNPLICYSGHASALNSPNSYPTHAFLICMHTMSADDWQRTWDMGISIFESARGLVTADNLSGIWQRNNEDMYFCINTYHAALVQMFMCRYITGGHWRTKWTAWTTVLKEKHH